MSSPSHQDPGSEEPSSFSSDKSLGAKIKKVVVGAPRDIHDKSIFHRLSLIALLAWIGLGADGLSSSSYGPEEAFRTLGQHTYLAVGLALLTAMTVIIISAAYSRIIEEFPHGGGGYFVATKLLGERMGVVSGCALLVDYVLTITVSIACAGDTLFSFLPPEWFHWRYEVEMGIIVFLMILNIRGVKESVLVLTPIFVLFLILHVILIGGGILLKSPHLPALAVSVGTDFRAGLSTLGLGGMALLFAHAFSLGGGTYTGIEAVSNGLPVMREPRARTARRTMLYMSVSLAFTAGGLLLCYLLWDVSTEVKGKTLNAVLVEKFVGSYSWGKAFVIGTLVSEGALLVVGAQAGFIDGPRVLANMAVDGWVPRRFAALSGRLTTQNGIVLMGGASLAALVYTHGDVRALVVMYSINVFLTFSISMFGMARLWLQRRKQRGEWLKKFAVFAVGLMLCATILCITVLEKFTEGGWITLLVTTALICLCLLIRRHYRLVGRKLAEVYKQLEEIPESQGPPPGEVDPKQPTAAVLVANYSGLGIHTVLNVFRQFPGLYKNLVFLSVGVVDSGEFKGEGAIEALQSRTEKTLSQYLDLARKIGVPATSRYALGTDAVEEAEKLCLGVAREFPRAVFFAGKLVFQREKWYQQLLHNETAFDLLKRLNEAGRTLVVLPARVEAGPRPKPV